MTTKTVLTVTSPARPDTLVLIADAYTSSHHTAGDRKVTAELYQRIEALAS